MRHKMWQKMFCENKNENVLKEVPTTFIPFDQNYFIFAIFMKFPDFFQVLNSLISGFSLGWLATLCKKEINEFCMIKCLPASFFPPFPYS